MKVGLLSQIGYKAEKHGILQENVNAPDFCQEHFSFYKINGLTMDNLLLQKYNEYICLKNRKAEYCCYQMAWQSLSHIKKKKFYTSSRLAQIS